MPTKDELEAELAQSRKELNEALDKLAANPAASAAGGTANPQVAELERENAELKKALATKPSSPQPSPRDTLPGQVWDPNIGKAGRFVPYLATADARFKIASPNKSFNEAKAGVHFREGVGRTNDSDLATWFETLGYTVTAN